MKLVGAIVLVTLLGVFMIGCGGDDSTDDGTQVRGDTGTDMSVTNDATPGDPPPALPQDPPSCQVTGNFSSLMLSTSKATVSGTYQCYACSGVLEVPGGCLFTNRNGKPFVCVWNLATDGCS